MNWIGLGALIYLLLFVLAAMVWRSYRVWKMTGINPYRLGATPSVHDYVGRWFKLVIVGIALVAALSAFFPAGYDTLRIHGWPQTTVTSLIGFGLMTIALIWVLIAQAHMGASWRIGIDDANTTALVRGGLFQFSRNPIFLGMRICLLGLLLVLPNAVNLALCILGEVLIQIQVRLEEQHLSKLHGVEYDAYRTSTRRWI